MRLDVKVLSQNNCFIFQVIHEDIESLATLGTTNPPFYDIQTSCLYTLSKRLEMPKAPTFGEKANHKLEGICSAINNKGPKTFTAHVQFKDGDEYLEETSFAFRIDASGKTADPMMLTYPGYVFVRRPIMKSISWITMSEWEYIEQSQITNDGKYGLCLASKTMDHLVENAIIVLKLDKRVEARVILTPGYAKEDSILYLEQHNLVMAVCHDPNNDEWQLVCFDLEVTFADSSETTEVNRYCIL